MTSSARSRSAARRAARWSCATREFKALGAVPTKPDRRKFSMLTTLLPLVGGLAMFAVTKSPVFLLMTGMIAGDGRGQLVAGSPVRRREVR